MGTNLLVIKSFGELTFVVLLVGGLFFSIARFLVLSARASEKLEKEEKEKQSKTEPSSSAIHLPHT
jgi:hypothetical protein